jgi:hypothetical protein
MDSVSVASVFYTLSMLKVCAYLTKVPCLCWSDRNSTVLMTGTLHISVNVAFYTERLIGARKLLSSVKCSVTS